MYVQRNLPLILAVIVKLALIGAFGCGGEGGGTDPMADAALSPDVAMETDMMTPDAESPCECAAETRCTADGECIICSTDDECLGDRICNDGSCVAGCSEDSACLNDVAGDICQAGRCVECATDDDCFGGATCGSDAKCVEPETCLDNRECNGARVCLSGACAERPDCNVNFECPIGQECQADGTCVLGSGEGCQSNSDCPRVGDVCLSTGRSTICGRCRTDEDCGVAFRCLEENGLNTCVERTGCSDDSQCLNGRICTIDGVCAAPPCTDDAREDNDTQETAVGVSSSIYSGLVSCADDPDWYQFGLEAGQFATVQLRQDGLDADLALTAFNVNGQILAQSSTVEPNETIVVGPFPSQLTVYIEISQTGGVQSTESYTLDVSIEEAGTECVEDAVDNSGGDDTIERARRVRDSGQIGFDASKLSGTLCPDNIDTFCFFMNSQEQLLVEVSVLSGDVVIQGDLTRPDGDVVASGSWQRTGQATDINTRTGAGEYCLSLNASEGYGSYQVNLTAMDSRLDDECAASQAVSWQGDSLTLQGNLSEDSSMAPLCAADADGGEYRYQVTFDEADNLPLLVTARVSGLAGGSLGDPVISVRRGCAVAASEIACSTQSYDANDPTTPRVNPAQLKFIVDEPGSYFVIVDGREVGDRPSFRLDMTATPAGAELGDNDLCGADTPTLPLNPDGVTAFAVNLDRGTKATSSCSALQGPDAIYRVSFTETSDVRLQALAVDQGFAVGASLISACSDPNPVACGFGFEARVEPGEYFLVIKGADTHSRGRVSVQMVVEPLGPAIVNDRCESAEAIGGEGSLIGTTATASDDYVLSQANTCTGYNTIGPDVVYRLTPPSGGATFVKARPLDGWDLSLYVYSNCGDLISPSSRVACSPDGALTERVVFDPATSPGPYFVIVDGTNGESGSFELTWGAVECLVSQECPSGQTCDTDSYQCR